MYLDFGGFFKQYGWIIAIVLVVLIAIIVAVLLTLNHKKSKRRNDNKIYDEIVLALGNKDNILSIEAKMSRLNVGLKNDSAMDVDKLKSLGVARIIKMSNKVTLVIGNVAQDIADKFNAK